MLPKRHSDHETRRGCDHPESRSPTLFAPRRGRTSGAPETQFDLPGSGKMDSPGTNAKRSDDSRRRLLDQTYFRPARVLAGTATSFLATGIRSLAGSVPLVSKSDAPSALVSFGIQFRVLLPSCTSIDRAVFSQSRPEGRQVEEPEIPGNANGFAPHSFGVESAFS